MGNEPHPARGVVMTDIKPNNQPKIPGDRDLESQIEPKPIDKVPFDRSLPTTRSVIEPPITPKVDRSL